MITNINKIANVVGLTTLLAVSGFSAAVVKCADAYAEGTRVVRTCEGFNCDGDRNKGTEYQQNCKVWCCRSDYTSGSHYDPNNCTDKTKTGCCPVNSGPTTPGWSCPTPPAESAPMP